MAFFRTVTVEAANAKQSPHILTRLRGRSLRARTDDKHQPEGK